jgi:hypothetical protein
VLASKVRVQTLSFAVRRARVRKAVRPPGSARSAGDQGQRGSNPEGGNALSTRMIKTTRIRCQERPSLHTGTPRQSPMAPAGRARPRPSRRGRFSGPEGRSPLGTTARQEPRPPILDCPDPPPNAIAHRAGQDHDPVPPSPVGGAPPTATRMPTRCSSLPDPQKSIAASPHSAATTAPCGPCPARPLTPAPYSAFEATRRADKY